MGRCVCGEVYVAIGGAAPHDIELGVLLMNMTRTVLLLRHVLATPTVWCAASHAALPTAAWPALSSQSTVTISLDY